jgi:tetratricopeptide (TPR) repeat protein
MGKLMGQGQDTQSTTIMGVRGFPDTPEGIAASEYYDTGMEYLRSGKYQAALDMFTECLGYVRLEQLNELYLQIALAQAGLGQKNSALMTLEASALTPESGSYAEYAVFRAGLLLELLDFSSVLSFIQRVDTSAFGDEDKASIILLEAFAYNGLGRSAEYKTAVAKLSKKPYLNTEAGLLASGLKQ